MSSNWCPRRSRNSRLVPGKRRGGRKSRKSDSLLNQARRSSRSSSSTNERAVPLACSRPSQCPAKYRSLLVRCGSRTGLLLQIVMVGKSSWRAHCVCTLVAVGKANQCSTRFEDHESSRPSAVHSASVHSALRTGEEAGEQAWRRPCRRVRSASGKRLRLGTSLGTEDEDRRECGNSRAMNVHSVARAAHGTASFPSQGAVSGAIMGQQTAKEWPRGQQTH